VEREGKEKGGRGKETHLLVLFRFGLDRSSFVGELRHGVVEEEGKLEE